MPYHGSLRYEIPHWGGHCDGYTHAAHHVWAGRANFYLHDHEICQSPPNEVFIDILDKIVAWQDRTSCLQLLLRPSRTMLPTSESATAPSDSGRLVEAVLWSQH